MYNVTLIGATGYAGAEFVRLITSHPNFKLTHIVSHSSDDKLCDLYKNLIGFCDLKLEPFVLENLIDDTDVFVTALPHGASMEIVKEIYENTDKKVVDLGADFRYDNIDTYEQWYPVTHTAREIPSVYGLCELNREAIVGKRVVGNPGCYTTTSILALAPAVANKIVDVDTIIVDAKSGATGAGKKCSTNTHFCETDESMKAYSIAVHRHTSEIEEKLSKINGKDFMINFTPHLLPVKRGILATCYAKLNGDYTTQDVLKMYKDYYDGEQFVKVLEDCQPELKFVVGSNNCYIGVTVDERTKRLIVVSCLDNLIKGASGQAIQNLNILFDLPENAGLNFPAMYL